MSKILCFVGKKGSGKNTLSSFLHGYQMKAYEKIDSFDLTTNGELVIYATNEYNEKVHTKLDITRTDLEFAEWAAYNMWPYIKNYAFATPLKEMCVHLFKIPYKSVYGTEEEKNERIEHIRWENMPGVNTNDHPPGPMSSREFLQYFGSDIFRRIYTDIWVDYCLKQIKQEDSQLAIISDGRFLNEIEKVQQAGGKTIYLTRTIDSDNHISENSVTPQECDIVLDNQNLTVLETCERLIIELGELGWFEE